MNDNVPMLEKLSYSSPEECRKLCRKAVCSAFGNDGNKLSLLSKRRKNKNS